MSAEPHVIADRNEFMHHAYNALYTGNIVTMPEPIVELMVKHIADDLCSVVRRMSQEKRDEFLANVTSQVRTN
jgi:hypothetical protein